MVYELGMFILEIRDLERVIKRYKNCFISLGISRS